MKKLIIMLFIPVCCILTTNGIAQSLKHPVIWVTNEERPSNFRKHKKIRLGKKYCQSIA